jgi:membrane protease YdiL (CAAX protease family)
VRALWQRYVTEVRQATDAEAQIGTDRRLVVIMLTVALCLLAMQFLGMTTRVGWLTDLCAALGIDGLGDDLRYALTQSPNARINGRVYWAVWRILGYVVIPMLVIRLALRERVRDFGLSARGTAQYWRIYAVLLVLLAPLVYVASATTAFQDKYPFYRLQAGESLWPWLWAWEALYALQFVGLEFFFRGFMLHGLVPRLGYASIFVMMVPYMMIHFSKPMPEALGSIVAGFVLGSLALKSRSIWWGAAAHVSVALSMDLLSLWRRGFL